ncbi:MAG TPA: OsmC family peroxiredoxin, partial [Thermoanaerobaculia bacterium]|nr:OsmC family peroxiredoxin [Thermoanaerobaculia bacterium]
MEISAQVQNGNGRHHVTLTTNGATHAIQIPPKPNGLGSAANGGEVLLLALATCYCNDIYRE